MDEMISVIMPVYNAAKYLDKSIQSVLNQSYQNLELLIINDGSTDNSADKIKQYAEKDHRIIFIDKPNEGVSTARNIGLSLARGEYVGFIDADDYFEKYHIENMISCDEADILFSGYKVVNNIGSNKVDLPWEAGKYDSQQIRSVILPQFLAVKKGESKDIVMGTVWRTLIKKRLIAENSLLFDKDLQIAEDFMFLAEAMLKADSLCVIPDYGYGYTRYEGTALHRYRPNCIEENQSLIKKQANLFKREGLFSNKDFKYRFYASKFILYIRQISNFYRHDAPAKNRLKNIKKIVCLFAQDPDMKNLNLDYLNRNRRFLYFLFRLKAAFLLWTVYKIKFLIDRP